MTNAKDELLSQLVGKASIKCARISRGDDRYYDPEWDLPVTLVALKVGYSEQEYLQFLEQLNFKYNSGFGGQELFGTVWLSDGTWLSRGEYDGSEWWDYNKLPEIPNELL
jgi:hypothetical protein